MKTTLVVALAAAIALSVAGSASARSRTAYFDAAKLGRLTGTFPIKTETDWTMTFTRLAHRPSGL